MHQAGNVGAVLAPGVAVLAVTLRAQFVPWVPLAAAGLLAAAAALALPETLGTVMSDTIQVRCLFLCCHSCPVTVAGALWTRERCHACKAHDFLHAALGIC